MRYCNNCINDQNIQEFIQEHGQKISDGYVCENEGCASDNCTHIINYEELFEWLEEIVTKVYSYNEALAYSYNNLIESEDESLRDFAPFINLYNVCYELFDDDIEKIVDLLCNDDLDWRDIADGATPRGFCDPDNECWLPVCWHDHGYEYIRWDDFSKEIKHSLRFFNNASFNREIELNKLVPLFRKLGRYRSEDSTFFRVRGILSEQISEVEADPKKSLGKAPPTYAGNNRFSPTGISYIYYAYDSLTAYKEVKCSKYEIYYCSEWSIHDEKNLLDLRNKKFELLKAEYVNPFKTFEPYIACALQVIKDFLYDIQKPIHDDDKSLEYIPTQVLAEFIQLQGYDGFVYESTKNENGINILLFKDDGLQLEHWYTIEESRYNND